MCFLLVFEDWNVVPVQTYTPKNKGATKDSLETFSRFPKHHAVLLHSVAFLFVLYERYFTDGVMKIKGFSLFCLCSLL